MKIFGQAFFLVSGFKTVLIFIIIFSLFLTSVRLLGTADGYPTRHLPISIIKEGNLELSEYKFLNSSGKLIYSLVDTGEAIVSKYPILPALLALPVYIIPSLFKIPYTYSLIATLVKISASLITAFSALFLFFILKRLIAEKWAIILTLAYALGTSNWTISSQELWQHGASQLFLVLTIFSLFKIRDDEVYLYLTGLFVGLAIAARPLNIIFAFFIFLFILHRQRKYIFHVILGLLPPLILLSFYNTYYFGAPWATGYGEEVIDGWTNPILGGFAGLLFSPSRGLFFFTPFLIFSIAGILYLRKNSVKLNGNTKIVLRYIALAVFFYILVLSKWWAWPGAYAYGPRMLTDIMPLMILLLIPVIKFGLFKKRSLKLLFVVLLSFSVLVQLVGIIFYDGQYQGQYYFDSLGNRKSQIWSLKEGQLYYYFNKAIQSF